jgi:RHS repeat-associated protein
LTRLVQANGVRTDRYYNDAGKVQYVQVNSPGWYIKYSPAGEKWAIDSIPYTSSPVFDADGFVIQDLVSEDARRYQVDVKYDAAHRVRSVRRAISGCAYANPLGRPAAQYCGLPKHRTLMADSWRGYGYDARGNVIEDTVSWELRADTGQSVYTVTDNPLALYDQRFDLRNRHDTTEVRGGWGTAQARQVVNVRQRFDREGNVRLKENFYLDTPTGPAKDTTFHYYTADGLLARSYVRADRTRSNYCVWDQEITYGYDGFGRRVRKEVRAAAVNPYQPSCDEYVGKVITYDYVYDGDQVLYEYIVERWAGGATEVTEVMFTRGPSGELLSRHVPGVVVARVIAGDTLPLRSLFYHLNEQGTPVAGTDRVGERYVRPDVAYEDRLYPCGPGAGGGGSGPFVCGLRVWSLEWSSVVEGDEVGGYIGQPYDPETGLHYFRNRYYDGQTGRFTQEDPIGLVGGLNLYAYAHNNPVNYTDPFGLCPEWKDWIPCVDPVPNFMTPADAPGQPSGVGGSEWGFTRSGGTKYHNGFDQAAPSGTQLKALGAGLLRVGRDDKAGLYVKLDLRNGTSVSFSHLSKTVVGTVNGEAVRVEAGQTIAFTGTSGNSSGSGREPHVHIVTRVGGRDCNPRDFFSKDGWSGSCGR